MSEGKKEGRRTKDKRELRKEERNTDGLQEKEGEMGDKSEGRKERKNENPDGIVTLNASGLAQV